MILLRTKCVQFVAVFTASLCFFTRGLHMGWTSPALPILLSKESPIEINTDEASWIVSCLQIGILFGSPIAGYLFDLIGRKNCILLTSIPHLLSWLIIAFSRNIYFIYFARLLAGMGEGIANTVAPVYVAEISELHLRGALGSVCSVMSLMGILFANVIGSYTTYFQTTMLCSVVVLVFFSSFILMPETPYYYLMKNDSESARKSLENLRGHTNVEEELNQISNCVEKQMNNKGTYRELFCVKSNRYALLIMTLLDATQQLCGITAIHSYCQLIFAQAGQNLSASTSAIIILSIQVIVSTSSTYLVESLGRRSLLIGSTFGAAIFLSVEGIYFYILQETSINLQEFQWVPLAAMISFIVAYSTGLALILNIMLGEIYSASIKAKASYLNCVFFAVFSFTMTKFFLVMSEVGMYLPFFVYVMFCSVGLVLIYMYVPETKGKTLDEIQNWLKTGSYEDVKK